MELDPKSCTSQVICVLAIWLCAYGIGALLNDPPHGAVQVASSQLDMRTSFLLSHLAR